MKKSRPKTRERTNSGQKRPQLGLRNLNHYTFSPDTSKCPKDPVILKIPRSYINSLRTQNGHFWHFGASFLVFSGYFGGIFRESSISGWGYFFGIFFVEVPGRPISGLCGRSGHAQPHQKGGGFMFQRFFFFFFLIFFAFSAPVLCRRLSATWAGQEPPLDAHHPWMPRNSSPEEFLSG